MTEPPAGEAAAYDWGAEAVAPEVSANVAVARAARDAIAAVPLAGVAVKSLAVCAGQVVAGLGDGRMALWNHRVFDGSAARGAWVLERVMARAGEKPAALGVLAPVGHTLVACGADGGMHLWM